MKSIFRLFFVLSVLYSLNSQAQGSLTGNSGATYASIGINKVSINAVSRGYLLTDLGSEIVTTSSNADHINNITARRFINTAYFYNELKSHIIIATPPVKADFKEGLIENPFAEKQEPQINDNYYALERGTDASGFCQVGVVTVVRNADKSHDFSLIYNTSDNTFSSYRLTDIDNDDPGHLRNIKWFKVDDNELVVYPNFAEDELNIKLKINTLYKIVIISADGKLYLPQVDPSENGVAKLNVSELPTGAYFINIYNENSTNIIQFIKE